jgi:hypothetical protein
LPSIDINDLIRIEKAGVSYKALASQILPPNSEFLEYIYNKQNDLSADGTGIMYPTVDAVNAGLGIFAQTDKITDKTLKQTGIYRPDTDVSVLSISPANTLNITACDNLLFINEIFPDVPANEILNYLMDFGNKSFVANTTNTNLPANTRGVFYVGLDKLGNAVYRTSKVYDQDVCYLARIIVANTAGVYTIVSFKYFPDLANNRINNHDRFVLQSGSIVPSGAPSISFGNRGMTFYKNSINYANNKLDPNYLALVDSVNPAPMQFLFLLPNITSLATSIATSTTINPTQWFTSAGAVGAGAVANTNYQVYKLWLSVTGTIFIQTKASTSNAPALGVNAIFANREDALAGLTTTVFPSLLPAGDAIALGTFYLRAGTPANGSGLNDPNDFYFLPLTATSSSSTVGVTVHDLLSGKNDNPAFQHVTTTDIGNWNSAFASKITGLTTAGNAGASTLVGGVLNVPNYSLAGLGGINFASIIAGFVTGANSTVLNTDSLEVAIEKLQGQINAKAGSFVAQPMTKIDDTNVTLTLGGTPATSLLQAVQLTLGWTGTLADARIASAPAWNAKVDGAGASGQVVFWTGAGTQAGKAGFIWDNTNDRLGLSKPNPTAKLDIGGSINIDSGLDGSSTRPALLGTLANGEIHGYTINFPTSDSGFLRLSAGGGTTANQKSFIDLTGPSNVTDMDRSIIMGVNGVEQFRLETGGKFGFGTLPKLAKVTIATNGNLPLSVQTLTASSSVLINFLNSAGVERGYVGFPTVGNSNLFLSNSEAGGHIVFNTTATGFVGFGTANPFAKATIIGSVAIDSNLNLNSPRPLISAGVLPYGEIRGYNIAVGADQGFLRLSAGGNTTPTQRSYIDISGNSSVADMNQSIVIGTNGKEKLRIDINGILTSTSEALTNNSAVIRNASYSSTDAVGTVSLGLGFADHSGAKIEAYKISTNVAGLKFYGEKGFNGANLLMQLESHSGAVIVGNSSVVGNRFISLVPSITTAKAYIQASLAGSGADTLIINKDGGNILLGTGVDQQPSAKVSIGGKVFFATTSGADTGGAVYGFSDGVQSFSAGLKFQGFKAVGANPYTLEDAMILYSNGNVNALGSFITNALAGGGVRNVQVDNTGKLVAGGAGLKRYVATIQQSGTGAPVATVMENTLGGTVVWSRAGAGDYRATLSGAFTLNKTAVSVTLGYNTGNNLSALPFYPSTVNECILKSCIMIPPATSAVFADGVFNSSTVIIEVFP